MLAVEVEEVRLQQASRSNLKGRTPALQYHFESTTMDLTHPTMRTIRHRIAYPIIQCAEKVDIVS